MMMATALPAHAEKLFSKFYLDEVRVGIFDHDSTFISSSEEEGVALNLELRFMEPWDLGRTLELRPTLGATWSLADDTDAYYGGVTLTILPYDPFFIDIFFGVAFPDSDVKPSEREVKKYLGCDALFREGVEAGVTIGNGHRFSAMYSHMSHGEILCSGGPNPGMDHFGVRYGFSF
jgi:lipid A 3-O-deacylase